jgi:lipoate-protein ligase A
MGLDEALLNSVAEGRSLPTLRFYGWEPPAVSIGYFQGLHEEVDVDACRAAGVDVVRRITGGGAVFHHYEVTYSIVLPLSHQLARPNILDSYRLLLGGIIDGLALLGIEAEFAPINDIVTGGKKISGNAQTRKRGCILQHGTILLDVEADLMFSLLKVPQEKAKGKLIEDVKQRVTSVRHFFKNRSQTPIFEETVDALKQGFASALELSLVSSRPDEAELAEARRLADEKFGSLHWTELR